MPDKKRYLEFVTALLTIPVLLTVMISNILNLQQKNAVPEPTPVPTVIIQTATPIPQTPISTPVSGSASPTPTVSAQCKKEVGPIEITYPTEGQMVSTDPVCLDIVRSGTDYCAVVWQYRINESAWSDYTDRSICMYGLTGGTKNLELRVKSIVSGNEVLLKRTFTIPTSTPTPTTTPTPTMP